MSELYTPQGNKIVSSKTVVPKTAEPLIDAPAVFAKLEKLLGYEPGQRFPIAESGALRVKPDDAFTIALGCALALELSGILSGAVAAYDERLAAIKEEAKAAAKEGAPGEGPASE